MSSANVGGGTGISELEPAKYETRIGNKGSKPSDMYELMMAAG